MRARWILPALLIAAAALPAGAQETPAETAPEKPAAQAKEKPPSPAPAGTPVPLRVTVVISRYQKDKKISSLPYELGVTANGPRTTLRMGVDVPIAMGSSTTYRSVGTNIDCVATSSGDRFQLNMTVADSSVHLDTPRQGGPAQADPVPSFRTFNSSFSALLRDGQTTQYTSATDPVSGEVMKIDVRLDVLK